MEKVIYNLVFNRKKQLNAEGKALIQVEAYLRTQTVDCAQSANHTDTQENDCPNNIKHLLFTEYVHFHSAFPLFLFIKSMCSRIKKNRDSIAKHMKILYNDKKMNCKLIVRILFPIL